MALLQMKLQKKKVFEVFMAYFLPQHHGEMYAEQMINKILDDNKGDSPEFRTYWPLTSYMYRSKFLTGALIILRKDCFTLACILQNNCKLTHSRFIYII